MFNIQKQQLKDPTYLFDLTRYYKIWFSSNPDQFLGIEDKLRFIRMREDNPREKLHFIFSRVYLTPKAHEDLNKFCTQYKINPIAFEDLESRLLHDQDKELYKIAQLELINCISGTGGNLASASDCVRLLVPIIEQYGIYSDFDVRSCLSKLQTQYVTLRGPLLFPAETLILDQQSALLSPNSDFFACSLDKENHKNLSRDALGAIRRLQAVILKKYLRPMSAEKIFGLINLNDIKLYPELSRIFSEFHRLCPANPSIFDFRDYVKGLPSSSLKTFLTRVSVINVSGPGTYVFLFSHLFPNKIIEPPVFIEYQDKNWLPFLQLYERCGTGFYDPIYDAIDSKNSIVKALSLGIKTSSKDVAEFSWTEDGMNKKHKREQKIVHSALKIEGFWFRKLQDPSYKLYNEVKKLSSVASIIDPLKQGNIPLTFRRCCAAIKLDIVKILVMHHQKHPFNVNSASPSNSNTALDWITKAKPENNFKEQQEIIRLLKSIGAKTSSEIIADQQSKQVEVQRGCIIN
jgi:hypothetical protein